MKTKSVFIAGTDVGAGKSFVGLAMLRAAGYAGLKTAGFKPVATGCNKVDGRLRDIDALAFQSSSTLELNYEDVNPIAFGPPVSPHLVARKVGEQIDPSVIEGHYQRLVNQEPDLIVIEGAGGWRVPLDEHSSLSDFVTKFAIPVVLVVGLKAGCLNHALLSVEAIQGDGLTLMGWVASQIDPDMRYMRDTVLCLDKQLDVPCLGVLSRLADPDEAIDYLDLSSIV